MSHKSNEESKENYNKELAELLRFLKKNHEINCKIRTYLLLAKATKY